jgi:hypothetical protein
MTLNQEDILMSQHSQTEDIVQDAIEQAERACQVAVEETPASYRGFLTFIRQNKRVGGSRQQPLYATIRLPYMRVDGRVKMALDEHRRESATFVIQTQFETDPLSEQLLCRATVTSALLGSVTAHARVFLNGAGVDATNPMENAETSAVGRALGFLGYGLYGTGIASAEEVLLAVTEREAQSVDKPNAENGLQETSSPASKLPSQRQLAFLRDLLEQAGRSADDIEASMSEIVSSQDASVLIDQLRKQLVA